VITILNFEICCSCGGGGGDCDLILCRLPLSGLVVVGVGQNFALEDAKKTNSSGCVG